MRWEADILDQSCAARGLLCDGFCCRAVHKHVMWQGWETTMLSTPGMVMTAFVASPGQGCTLHHLQVRVQSPTQHCCWPGEKTEVPFLMQPVMGTSFP